MNTHKRIGLLGLGARSTSFYLERLNRLYHRQHGGFSTCPLTLINSDFDEFNPFLPNQFKRLEPALRKYLELIVQYDNVLIPNITLHETLDKQTLVSTDLDKIHHPISLTASRLNQAGIREATIVGSAYSMTSRYLPKRFEEYGIQLHAPDQLAQARFDKLRQAVYTGQETTAQVSHYHEELRHLSTKRIVVIACTELSLITHKESSNVIDMASVHIQHCFDRAFSER